jgi:pSer/pThr/pTyr-binding forkhead associated (FHA) protein
LLVTEGESDETTQTFSADEVHDDRADLLEELGIEGPALVIRSGGGRTGEGFSLDRPQTSIGRSPDCDIFLDDVTVSRRHAVVTHGSDGFTIEDLGSLNGTFLNRSRIDRDVLENGDEVQIGKYRLIFLAR